MNVKIKKQMIILISQQRLYDNLARTLISVRPDIVMNQLHLFSLVHPNYAEGVLNSLKSIGFKNE
jgi:catalase